MAEHRILIVEDSPTMRQLLVFALKRLKNVEHRRGAATAWTDCAR